MKVGYKKLGLVLGAVVALALMPARADAQMVRYSPIFWSFDVGGGYAIPLGTLSDNMKAGPSLALGASYFLNPRLALRAEGGLSWMGDTDAVEARGADPQLQIWTYTGGIEYHISDPTGDLMFTVDFGVGGATFDSKVFTVNDYPTVGASTTGTFNKTRMAIDGGLKVGYNFARHAATGVPMATIYLKADANVIFTKNVDTALWSALNSAQPFGTGLLLPITAGIRVNLP